MLLLILWCYNHVLGRESQSWIFFTVCHICHVPYFNLNLTRTHAVRTLLSCLLYDIYNVRNEIKCSGEAKILHELVHDTARKSENRELIRVVIWTNSCSISVTPLHFISFRTVHIVVIIRVPALYWKAQYYVFKDISQNYILSNFNESSI